MNKEIVLRPYQIEAVSALLRDIKDHHPLVAAPTGSGKTFIIADFIYKYLEKTPSHNILILSHTSEILTQDYNALQLFFPGIIFGLYSSTLKSKTISKITVAGIQSVYRYPNKFIDFDTIIIDEAHSIPRKQNSMYQKFFNNIKPEHKRVGLSATIFRTKSGYLHEGKGRMFDKLSYDLSSATNFTKLIDDGYLCPLMSKATNYEMDTKGVKTTAGDYNQKDLGLKLDRYNITKIIVKETIQYGKNYKSWLIFAINIEHAEHINNEFKINRITSKCLHNKIDEDKDSIIKDYKEQKFKALVSVGMITTGFDAPNIDLIAMMCPTKSLIKHIQTAGRGTRPLGGKKFCLFLDYAGNTKRLGPINHITVTEKGKKKKGKAPVKQCHRCSALYHVSKKICDICNFKFEFKEKLQLKKSDDPIIVKNKKNKSKWLTVDKIYYNIHKKSSRPNSLKVTYLCGLSAITEYICLEHDGYAKIKAKNWINHRWVDKDKPNTVKELFEKSPKLKIPKRIKIVQNNKFYNIIDVLY